MLKNNLMTISVRELKNRRDSDPALCLIDVREQQEWDEIRIPGAILIPKNQITAAIKQHVFDSAQPIYLHCRGGVRSLHAADSLIELGYKEVYSIDGGIVEWEISGYPVERDE